MPGDIELGGWLKQSFIDFPRTVATVLFFRGCNLRCPYCHNPSLVDGSMYGVPFSAVLAHVRKRRGIIDGAVLSGGEPTLQGATLVKVAAELRAEGLRIKLDTNGLLPEVLTAIAPDYCALDIKTTPDRYAELGWRGAADSQQQLLSSLAIVKKMGKHAEVRITVASPFITPQSIEVLLPLLEGVENLYLQPFRKHGELLDPLFGPGAAYAPETLDRFRTRFATVVNRCEIRGSA